jgi:hypothetical protein
MKDLTTIILSLLIFLVGIIVGAGMVYNHFPYKRTHPTIEYYTQPFFNIDMSRDI